MVWLMMVRSGERSLRRVGGRVSGYICCLNVFVGDSSIGRRVGRVISRRHVFGGGRFVGGRVSRVGNRQQICLRQRLLRRQVCQDGFHCKGISLFHIFQPFLFITLFCPPCILHKYRKNRIYIRHTYTHNTYEYERLGKKPGVHVPKYQPYPA